jgi:hypothetical protein
MIPKIPNPVSQDYTREQWLGNLSMENFWPPKIKLILNVATTVEIYWKVFHTDAMDR